MALVTDAIDRGVGMPSYSMICDQLDISDKSTVRRIVARLERRGLVTRSGQGREHRIGVVA